jgi:phage terminase Nu1 subunit (DNA packaging protein)
MLEEKLRVIHTAIELCRQRLEWVLFDTPFTIKQLEEEINNAKAGTSDPEIEREKEMMKQFLKDHKINQIK